MLTLIDIKKAIADKIRTKYNYKIYNNDVTEGFEKPCFFIRLLPILCNKISTTITQQTVTVEITYFQNKRSELDNLKVAQELQQLFQEKLEIKDRKLNCDDIRIDWAGEQNEILQVLFDLQFYQSTDKQYAEPPAGEIKISEVND